ncbi:MAG: hypothetical protein ABIC40_05760 [bacterium]
MTQETGNIKGRGKYWKLTLIYGFALTLIASGWIMLQDLLSGEFGQNTLNSAGSVFMLFGIPVVAVSAFLWFKPKRVPSLAFIVTCITGIFFTIFSGEEAIVELSKKPFDVTAAVSGLREIAIFSLPFWIVAWILWVKPVVGGWLLIMLGCGMGAFMLLRWNGMPDFIMLGLLVLFPIVLGIFTVIRERFRRIGSGDAVSCL